MFSHPRTTSGTSASLTRSQLPRVPHPAPQTRSGTFLGPSGHHVGPAAVGCCEGRTQTSDSPPPPMPVSGGPKWEVALLSQNNKDTHVLPRKFLLTVKNLKTHKNRRKVDQSSLPVRGVEKEPGNPVQRLCRLPSSVFPVRTEKRREAGSRK